MQINTLVLSKTPYDITPIKQILAKLHVDCRNWWSSKGVFIEFTEAESLITTDEINYTLPNPWYQTKDYLDLNSRYGYHLVFLNDWNDPNYAGWGGYPLAVGGEWALRALESVGSPDAIVDDWKAGYLVLHEIGHAFGLPHDFNTRCSFMSYDWCGYNSVVNSDEMWTRINNIGQAAIIHGDPIPCELRL